MIKASDGDSSTAKHHYPREQEVSPESRPGYYCTLRDLRCFESTGARQIFCAYTHLVTRWVADAGAYTRAPALQAAFRVLHIPTSSETVQKVSGMSPTSDGRVPFWTAPPSLIRLSGECVAALLVLGRSGHNIRQKRRHPFERQRTTRGGAVQIRAQFSKVGDSLTFAQSLTRWVCAKPNAHPEPTISLHLSILDGRFVMHCLARILESRSCHMQRTVCLGIIVSLLVISSPLVQPSLSRVLSDTPEKQSPKQPGEFTFVRTIYHSPLGGRRGGSWAVDFPEADYHEKGGIVPHYMGI